MAGVERARTELWGSDAVKAHGATYLPQLKEGDLWVEPCELDAFEAEVRMLQNAVEELRAELGRGPDCTLPHYLNNFIRTIEFARSKGGGVSIR